MDDWLSAAARRMGLHKPTPAEAQVPDRVVLDNPAPLDLPGVSLATLEGPKGAPHVALSIAQEGGKAVLSRDQAARLAQALLVAVGAARTVPQKGVGKACLDLLQLYPGMTVRDLAARLYPGLDHNKALNRTRVLLSSLRGYVGKCGKGWERK